LIFFLFLIFAALLFVDYVPERIASDRRTAEAALILEEPVDGVEGYKLFSSVDLADADFQKSERRVLLIDLKKDWKELERLVKENQVVILTGIPPETPEEVAQLLDENQVLSGYIEFDERGAFVQEVMKHRKYPSLVFRVHLLKPKEYPNYDLDSAVIRYIRAVRERKVDALLFMEGKSETLDYSQLVKSVKAELEKEKLLGEEIVPVLYDVANSKILARTTGFFAIASWNPFLAIGYLIVLLISSTLSLTYLAVVGEIALFVVIIRLSSRIRSVFITVLLFFLASLGLGLAINAQMTSPAYQNGIELFRGVKLSLIALPAIIFFLGFFRRREKKLNITDTLLLVLAVLAGIYYLLRSGNYSFVLSVERTLRDVLDKYLVVRPRFKELLGYPFLIFAANTGFTNTGKLGAVLPTLGSVAFVSVVNTFCHATAPLWTILLRSVYGFIFGSAIGFVFLFISKLSKKGLSESSEEIEDELNEVPSKESKKA